jgi:hypothetical protein
LVVGGTRGYETAAWWVGRSLTKRLEGWRKAERVRGEKMFGARFGSGEVSAMGYD